MKYAIAWEVLRRLPHTYQLLTTKPYLDMFDVPIERDLLKTGTSSWKSLKNGQRDSVMRSLGEHPTKFYPMARRFRLSSVRNLFEEATQRLPAIEKGAVFICRRRPDLDPSRWGGSKPWTNEERELALLREVAHLQRVARSRGFPVISLAIDLDVVSPSDIRVALEKILAAMPTVAPRSRARIDALKIIGKFGKGTLKRKLHHDKEGVDLVPYRELIEKYEVGLGLTGIRT